MITSLASLNPFSGKGDPRPSLHLDLGDALDVLMIPEVGNNSRGALFYSPRIEIPAIGARVAAMPLAPSLVFTPVLN